MTRERYRAQYPEPRYDYENQAWVIRGEYADCNHPADMDCRCYGRLHAGEEPTSWASIMPTDEEIDGAPPMPTERAQDTPQDADALLDLSSELAAVQRAHRAETARLQLAADALTFGRPRNPHKLRPARNLDLFSPEPQRRLF